MTHASTIIKALRGNHQGMCRCPAHKDKTPSLHVSEGANGKVLLKCHAGCSQEAVIRALKGRGLWGPSPQQQQQRQRDWDMQEDQQKEHERWRKAIAILRAGVANDAKPTEYLKNRGISIVPDNAMVMSAKDSARLTGRRFPAMVMPFVKGDRLVGAQVTHLNKDGTGKLDAKPAKKSYGPIKGGYVVLGPIETDEPLLVGEGIETVLSAMQITGLPGIACIGTTLMEAVEVPQCSEVIIVGDNDDPGEKAAKTLAQRLANEGRTVRIALPEYAGDDWNVVLRKDRDKLDEVREQIIGGGKRIKPERRVLPVPAEDFMALVFPKRELHLRPWLPKGSLSMVHAQRGHGKTWVVLSIARAVSAGEGLLGWSCEKPGRVLYFDGELPGELLQKRLELLGKLPRDLLILSREQFNQRRKMMPDLGTVEGRETLDQIIDLKNPDVIILDSLSALVRSGAENEAESWAPVADWMMQHRWRGRSIILVHHEGRGLKPRGTSKREDVLDTMIGLKERIPKPGEEVDENETSFDLTFTKHRDFFGKDAIPMVLHLNTSSGRVEWEYESASDDQKTKVAKLLKQNWKQKDIAKELGVTESRVSQIKAELERDKYFRVKSDKEAKV